MEGLLSTGPTLSRFCYNSSCGHHTHVSGRLFTLPHMALDFSLNKSENLLLFWRRSQIVWLIDRVLPCIFKGDIHRGCIPAIKKFSRLKSNEHMRFTHLLHCGFDDTTYQSYAFNRTGVAGLDMLTDLVLIDSSSKIFEMLPCLRDGSQIISAKLRGPWPALSPFASVTKMLHPLPPFVSVCERLTSPLPF